MGIKVRNITLGEGKTKVCIPLVSTSADNIEHDLRDLKSISFDILEWRMDYYKQIAEKEHIDYALDSIREAVKDAPILATFRTKEEGGVRSISNEDYIKLLKYIIRTGKVDMIDIEFFKDEEAWKQISEYAHKHNVVVVASNHHFDKTPSKEEMIEILCSLKEKGADVPKLAVMPANDKDVLALIEATHEVSRVKNINPIITMSMGEEGLITRIAAEFFGSCLTFACVKKSSAPGQVPVSIMYPLMRYLHDGREKEIEKENEEQEEA